MYKILNPVISNFSVKGLVVFVCLSGVSSFFFSKLLSSLKQSKTIHLNLNGSCIASVSDTGKDAARDRASTVRPIKPGWKCIKHSMFIC